MATATSREQGRYLGGRPPYGYRLVDAVYPERDHWIERGRGWLTDWGDVVITVMAIVGVLSLILRFVDWALAGRTLREQWESLKEAMDPQKRGRSGGGGSGPPLEL